MHYCFRIFPPHIRAYSSSFKKEIVISNVHHSHIIQIYSFIIVFTKCNNYITQSIQIAPLNAHLKSNSIIVINGEKQFQWYNHSINPSLTKTDYNIQHKTFLIIIEPLHYNIIPFCASVKSYYLKRVFVVLNWIVENIWLF